jgi:hypothetical protein
LPSRRDRLYRLACSSVGSKLVGFNADGLGVAADGIGGRSMEQVLQPFEEEAQPSVTQQPKDSTPSHPVGTLVIVGLYGALFAVGWLAVYAWVYIARGAVTP